jgi:hypothetical protein
MEHLWSRAVATGGKWVGPKNGSDKRKPLPWVATSCRSERMVSRGSMVRVRQRLDRTPANEFTDKTTAHPALIPHEAPGDPRRHPQIPGNAPG